MGKVLVSIVSEQTVPNVLFIKEIPADFYLFVTTERMERNGRTQDIIRASGLREEKTFKTVVKEDSIKDIQERLSEFSEQKLKDNDRILLNLTGGTKIMSIAAYEFFKNRGNAYIYYIPIGKNIYRQIYPQVKHRENELRFRISLEEYLKAYGIELTHDRGPLMPFDISEKILRLTLEGKFSQSLAKQLRGLRSDKRLKKKRKIEVEEVKDLKILFPKISWPEEVTSLDKYHVEYLSGGWLEEYIYYKLKKFLPKENLKLGVRIKKQEVENELDVIFISENKPWIVETKSSFKNLRLSDVFYKLNTLRKTFGLNVEAVLAAPEEVKSGFKERANELNIKIWDKRILEEDKFLEGKLEQIFQGGR